MPHEDYFSIDDILATEPRVYATFRVRGHMLGHLDPLAATLPPAAEKENAPPESPNIQPASTGAAAPGRDLRLGRRVALPFWLVRALAARGHVDVATPRCYGARVRNDLLADAVNVNLAAKCASYYALGLRVAELTGDRVLVAMLSRALAERAWPAVDAAAYGSATGKGAAAMARLECWERELFFATHGGAVALARWKERTGDRIRPRNLLGKRRAARGIAMSPVTPRARAPQTRRLR